MRGFHGRTMGSLSITWEKKYRRPFEPLVDGVTHVPMADVPSRLADNALLSGASIDTDGNVFLILDVLGLFQFIRDAGRIGGHA